MVYRGGLENRFGLTPDGGSNPSLSAKFIVNNWTSILIWTAVVLGIFGYLWWQGQIRQLATYVQETREELKKCSWPSWAELKGSTVVIMISILMLGAFTEVVDRVLYFVFFVI